MPIYAKRVHEDAQAGNLESFPGGMQSYQAASGKAPVAKGPMIQDRGRLRTEEADRAGFVDAQKRDQHMTLARRRIQRYTDNLLH